MPSKRLAAKSSVFKLPKQGSSIVNGNFVYDCAMTVATKPDLTKDGFYNNFFKMLGYYNGDIVGLEGASGLRSDQPGRRRVGKGDEFNKAAPALPAQAAPAPAAGKNGARPADELPTPPAGEGAEAGPCNPAPVPRPAAAKPGRRRG